jgi:DNA polymerase-3 subunit chi
MSDTGTRVDFYLLEGDNINNVRLFCCRLAEKAWKLGHRVWIRTGDEHDTRVLDDLLWTFSDGSFLPHASVDDAQAAHSPIIVGAQPPPAAFDLLINLASDIPDQAGQYPRIAEILDDDAARKQQGRARYSQYDKSNYTLQHHNMNS